MKENKIIYLDSMGAHNDRCLSLLHQYLKDEHNSRFVNLQNTVSRKVSLVFSAIAQLRTRQNEKLKVTPS